MSDTSQQDLIRQTWSNNRTTEQYSLQQPWYSTSDGAVHAYGKVSELSPNIHLSQLSFTRSVYSFEVKEDTHPGTLVGKVEAVHLMRVSPIIYSVLEDDGEGLFLFSPHSGEFLLSRVLDYETQRHYVLKVTMLQRDLQISSVRVYFNVVDVNDNSPVFRKAIYSCSLPEDTPVGTCFLALNVSDKDYGVNGETAIEVIRGDEEAVFLVNHHGVLCLNSELDRERRSIYNLTVQAEDQAQSPTLRLTSTALVGIQVDDVNDNAPFFVSAESFNIPEDTPIHTVGIVVQALDVDTGSNGDVFYTLVHSAGGVFSINSSSGNLYLQESLDREQIDKLTILLAAIDKGTPQLTTTMNLTVHVEDVNDHDPMFTQSSYTLTIGEDTPWGTSLLHVHTHDQDIGINGDVRYQLDQSGVFVVDSFRGVVTVMDKLDRETASSYMFWITAMDRGVTPRSARAAVTVSLLDVNDFTPLFAPATLTLHVLENEEHPSELKHKIQAVDEDLDMNGQLIYLIQRGNEEGYFSLSPSGMFQIVHSLDREMVSMNTIEIIAVDSGLPPLTGTATVHVIVDDMNDNRPVFTEDVFTTIVPEDIPLGAVFAMIAASDCDEGVSGQIRYSVEGDNRLFSIDNTSGELFTTGVLDREVVPIYTLTVIASDTHPTHPLSSSALVTVLIGDVNDHWPQFLYGPYVAYMPVDAIQGSVVYAVQAVDKDTGTNAQLQFSLYGQNTDQFTISPVSGTVFTLITITGKDDITVNVHVEDGGDYPKFDTTTITIRLQNASDFPVVNVDVEVQFLSENEPEGTLVTVVSAESSRRGPVSFHLVSGNLEEAFQLHPSNGKLTIKNTLDYESTKDYDLLVEARDAGSPPFSSYAEIHINISDYNDNVPEFTQREYRCDVFENAPPTWLCDVLAIDVDSESYGSVKYSIISGNSDGTFTIDSINGMISTTVSLDRETVPLFHLTVESVDQDNTIHRDTAIVLVVVSDTNDHAPRFSQIFMTEIPEDAPIGYTVLQILSTDDDIGPNAEITYSIINPIDDLPFNIDITSGYIMIVQNLDREMQDHYVLQVNANDSAWSISTDVSIDITDINDNRPVFSQEVYYVTLVETKDSEGFVMQVLATDADTGENSHILYVLEQPSEELWVNSTTGKIYTKQPLSLQHSSLNFNFTVLAYDCDSVPPHSNTTVVVSLVHYNHFPPTFLPIPSLFSIPFDLAVGTELAQLKAVDLDIYSDSMTVDYSSAGGNGSDLFVIQTDSGLVTLNQSLTQSLNTLLTLIVVANDRGFPPLFSKTELHFVIIGKNQFSPQFLKSYDTVSVPEDLLVGSVIGKVHAVDEDDGANGILTYSIVSRTKGLPFSIGPRSGLITLVKGVDFEKQNIYHLHISAKDGGWRAETGTINITVNITDVNDNPPVFTSSEYIASVPENSAVGTLVLQVMASDADSGTNAHITYSLNAGNIDKFALDDRNGSITTLDMFDFELEQMFELNIKASNTGGRHLFSVAHVTVLVSGVNEFIPAFQSHELNFTVLDSVPLGTVIGKVTATDFDQGFDGNVFYLLFGQSKKMGFDIDEQTGEIYTNHNLRELGYNHAGLRILAKNDGVITGLDIDEAFLQINIVDTNDPPEFTSTLYTTEVSEDTTVDTSIIKVSALDQDSILFSYSIISGNTNSSFFVNPFSGVVSVNSALDRELWPMYNMVIAAVDHGSPPATGTTNVVVNIGDINDNAPRLAFTEAYVRENQPHGTLVATLNASDADQAANQGPFTYWLVQPTVDSSFSLTSDGVLFTTRPVDREHTAVFHILIAVRDAGAPPLSSMTMLHVRVLDENDNPSLPRNIYIEVKYYGNAFLGGMIGHVQPEDLDESDVYNCSIKNGHLNMFNIPFGTCQLWSSPYQGEASYNITIEASDDIHPPVNNSVYVNYKGFTNASMNSCILFYLSSSSVEGFLSYKYLKFVKALDSLFNLQASKTHVFGIKPVADKILLLAAVKSYNGQYLNAEVASGISAVHRKLLESQSNATISQITSNPCLFDPCLNGATCNKDIHIYQDVALLESLAVAFVSPQMEIFNCSCSAGFTGTLCESDIDECNGNPCENEGPSSNVSECLKVKCQNQGSCLDRPDGFHCFCKDGYEGEFCERPVDSCASSPCIQGTCTNSLTGYSCLCPFGVHGVQCQEQSLGFEELSYMKFPPLDPHINIISLELATVQKNALLLYNPGSPASAEFISLEIREGRVRLSYNLGSGPVLLETKKLVVDGVFHSITARRIGNIGSLQVDGCTNDETNGFCFYQNEGFNSQRTLDGSSSMLLGGISSMESILQNPAQMQSHDFIGCIRNVKVNGIPLMLSKALATYNILHSCPRAAVSPCESSPCKNGGVCRDLWTHYLCHCTSRYTGINCATVISEEHVLQLNGKSYIEYSIRESYRRDVQLGDINKHSTNEEINRNFSEIEVKVKTVDNDGVLMFALGRIRHFILRIIEGKLQYISIDSKSGHLLEFTATLPVADGLWHVLHLFRDGNSTIITIDEQLTMTTNETLDLTPVNVETIVLGAAPPGDARPQQPGFSGCVAYFRVTGYILPVSGFNEMVEAWPSSALTQSSCLSHAICVPSYCNRVKGNTMRSCLSVSCRTGRDCKEPVMSNISCICLHNASTVDCDACLSVAENHDGCFKLQQNTPLWILAVLPVISLPIFLYLFVTMRRQSSTAGWQESCHGDSPLARRDNQAFYSDNDSTLAKDISRPLDVNRSDRWRPGVVCYSEDNTASLQTGVLEYYEIDSIYTACHSNMASLRLSWHGNLHNTDCDRMEPRWTGVCQSFTTDLPGGPISQESKIRPQQMWQKPQPDLNPYIPQNRDQGVEQNGRLNILDYEVGEMEKPPHLCLKRLPEFMSPPECLSVEEVRSLNSLLEETESERYMTGQLAETLTPRTSAEVIDSSTDSETRSSLTGSELESEIEFLPSNSKGVMCEFTLAAVSSSRERDAFSVPFGFRDNIQQDILARTEKTISGPIQQWKNPLRMSLDFDTYAQVFEDIAGLPIEPKHDFDIQSDQEEII